MQQHHKLGLWLHERYMVNNTLLNETYKKSEIWIRSSAYDRTIMSAQSCLSGLYMLKEKNIMELLWTPIPVWTEKMQSDYVSVCSILSILKELKMILMSNRRFLFKINSCIGSAVSYNLKFQFFILFESVK